MILRLTIFCYQEQFGSRNANDRALQNAFLSPRLPPPFCPGGCSTTQTVDLSLVAIFQLKEGQGLTFSSWSHQHMIRILLSLWYLELRATPSASRTLPALSALAGSCQLLNTCWWLLQSSVDCGNMMSGTRRIDVLLPSLFRLLLGLRTLQEASRYLANSYVLRQPMSCFF